MTNFEESSRHDYYKHAWKPKKHWNIWQVNKKKNIGHIFPSLQLLATCSYPLVYLRPELFPFWGILCCCQSFSIHLQPRLQNMCVHAVSTPAEQLAWCWWKSFMPTQFLAGIWCTSGNKLWTSGALSSLHWGGKHCLSTKEQDTHDTKHTLWYPQGILLSP